MPRFLFPHDQRPAEPPDVCEAAIFPIAVVPFALAALESRCTRYTWIEDSYLRGVQLVRSLQLALLCGGLREITDRQDALYRMLDTALYGTIYDVIETEPELIVAPEIEPVRALAEGAEGSIFGRMETQRLLLENALNGVENSQYDRPLGVRDLLEQLLTAVEASDDLDPEMLAKLVEIAAVLL